MEGLTLLIGPQQLLRLESVFGAVIIHKVALTPVPLIAQRLPAPIPRAAAPTVGAERGRRRSHRGGGVSAAGVALILVPCASLQIQEPPCPQPRVSQMESEREL